MQVSNVVFLRHAEGVSSNIKQNLEGNETIITQNAMKGCQLCSLRLQHWEKNTDETSEEPTNGLTDMVFSEAPWGSIYIGAWCARAGDFVVSVPEGL
jgi:hypothetical protein